jgi:Domain of unknown function (DUF4936)
VTTARLELYVYYRLPVALRSDWPARVGALQAELSAAVPGLQARVLRRADTPTGAEYTPDTWMEVYHRPVAGLDQKVIERIEGAATSRLAAWIQGERHREVFHAP